jgi:hypothetical protein
MHRENFNRTVEDLNAAIGLGLAAAGDIYAVRGAAYYMISANSSH